MKKVIMILVALYAGFTATQSYAQCSAAVEGGSCEGTTLKAITTGGTLQQLLWKWKSREDSLIHTSTAAVLYQDGITIAGGNGYDNNTPPDYEAADNQCEPHGICVDKAGNLYVVDALSSRVQKWVPGAKEGVTVAGGNGFGFEPNQLAQPRDVAVDATGNLYVSDANRIQKWSPGATEGITVAGGIEHGSGPNQLYGPTGICFDIEGNLYIADYTNDRVQKWAPGAKEGTTVAGGNGGGSASNQIHNPEGVFVDKEGNIYVTGDGYYSNRVQKWAPGGKEGVTVAGGIYPGRAANQLDYPQDVFVDDLGNIYVADGYSNRIQKWMPGVDTGVTIVGGNFGPVDGPNDLYFPNGVYIMGDTMYVSDAGHDRVQKFITKTEEPKIDYTYTPLNGGNYTATATFKQGCTATSPAVHVKGLPKFKSIKGQHRNLCGGGTFTYSADGLGEADSYTWAAPAGCTILNGQGTAAITLSIPGNFSMGVLSVSANNKCGTGPVFADTITTKPVKPGAVNGPASVAPYDTLNYSVEAEPDISYRWEIPVAGVKIISGQNTNAITVVWNSFNDGNVIVKAAACNGGTEASSRLLVKPNLNTVASSNYAASLVVKNTNTLKVYPNPAQNTATIAFTASGAYTIQLTDATGKLVKIIKGNASAGENRITVDLSRISRGLYFVTLMDKQNKKQVVRLSKQ